MNERMYICHRKLIAFANKLCFIFCRVFSIKRNRISICTFEGKGGFGCNPKYIVQELHRRNEDYEFIWFVNNMQKEFPSYVILQSILICQMIAVLFEMTSGLWQIICLTGINRRNKYS